MHKLRITGRLDRQSSGLMLLTDDGDFIQRHTHPSFEKLKVYEVTLPRPLHQAERDRLEAGIELKDGLSRLTVVLQVGRTVTLSMHEGRNRQIRRTFAELGLEVERLHRIQMGPYAIGELAPGTWRVMTREELS
jgi:23S rRNA pseudouridine2605 synthase